MTTETRKRREYTEDFKRDAMALVTEQGYKPSEVARSLGIGDNLIRHWKREFEEQLDQLFAGRHSRTGCHRGNLARAGGHLRRSCGMPQRLHYC